MTAILHPMTTSPADELEALVEDLGVPLRASLSVDRSVIAERFARGLGVFEPRTDKPSLRVSADQ